MTRQVIEIRQTFNAPVEEVFGILTDHESFGEIIGTEIKRVVDSPGENKNGVGSVRRIVPSAPVPAFEETVTAYAPNRLMEYTVSKGSPIKHHLGRLVFLESDGKTELAYTIEFEPRLPFVLLSAVLKRAVEAPIRKGLAALAKKYL